MECVFTTCADGDGNNIHSSTYDYIDTGLTNITSNAAYGVNLPSKGNHDSAGPLAGEDAEMMKVNEAYGVTQKTNELATSDDEGVYNYSAVVDLKDTLELEQNDAYTCTLEEPVTTTANGSYNYPAKFDPSNTIELNQNDAYAPKESVTTTANESYNYSAKFDPSNTIEAKENEAYAMNIVTEAYKLVVGVSGTSEEYEYI